MKYHVNHSSTKLRLTSIKRYLFSLMVTLPMLGGLVINSNVAHARGPAPTTKVAAVVSCAPGTITFTIDTISNDKVKQILVQADGANVLIRAVPRKVVSTITVDAAATRSWSIYRQERDSWIPDLNTQIQADGSCGPNTWL